MMIMMTTMKMIRMAMMMMITCVYPGGSTPSSVIAQYSFGRTLHQSIPPLGNWQMRFYLPNGEHVRFNLTVPSSAVVGIYGRQGIRPSHAQFDFFHVVDGRKGARTENARHSRSLSDVSTSLLLPGSNWIPNIDVNVYFQRYLMTFKKCFVLYEFLKVMAGYCRHASE